MTISGAESAFGAWKEHNNANRVDTELAVHEFLRKSYPDHHLTRTYSSQCDLEGFAAAGFAIIQPQETLENYVAIRGYAAPGPRLQKKPGALEDHVQFGYSSYWYKETEFIYYEALYKDFYMRDVNLYYLLAPKVSGSETARRLYDKATDELLLACGEWTKELHEEIYVFDDARWGKDKKLYRSVQDSSWDDVILDQDMKAKLMDDVQSFFDNRPIYRSLKVAWKRGVILHGLPGNGKTISIKALIKALSERDDPVPSLYVKSFDACNGPKWSIQRIFTHARSMAPCLLIFEDLDSLVTEKTRSYFLNEVDGLESNEGILMIGSTNHLDRLDSAITKRPSRFDRKYHFKLPGEAERTAYCQYWRKKLAAPGDEDVGLARIDFPDEVCGLVGKMTEGFSFAYMKELFITSLLLLARGGEVEAEVEEEEGGEALRSDDSSNGEDTVVVDKETVTTEVKSKDAETGAEATTTTETKKEKPQKPKRVLPVVEIPDHLQDNKLLHVVRAQAKTLLSEMDSSKEEAWKKKHKHPKGVMQARPVMYDSDSDAE